MHMRRNVVNAMLLAGELDIMASSAIRVCYLLITIVFFSTILKIVALSTFLLHLYHLSFSRDDRAFHFC